MVSSNAAATQAQASSSGFRWLQLMMGIVCMAMIANLQYGWTLFVDPINGAHHWGRAAIQFAFTIFVVTETWLVPVEAWFVDKYGPRLVIMFGGIMIALAWVLNSYADSLTLLYTAAVIGGIGAGAVYGTCVGNALKWFPDKRGLAAGITAAGFGAGSALTVAPIQAMIKDSGFQTTFLYFGLGQGIIIVLLAFFLLAPKAGQVPQVVQNAKLIQTRRNYQPTEVLRQPIFWLMYFMFVDVPHRPGTPPPFDAACLIMLGVFPLIVMFLITSITMQRERLIEPVSLRSDCDMSRACRPTWLSPISPSISARGTSAATESTTMMSSAPERISMSAISSACSPVSGWLSSRSSTFTPSLAA